MLLSIAGTLNLGRGRIDRTGWPVGAPRMIRLRGYGFCGKNDLGQGTNPKTERRAAHGHAMLRFE